jgi:hypothetical protein
LLGPPPLPQSPPLSLNPDPSFCLDLSPPLLGSYSEGMPNHLPSSPQLTLIMLLSTSRYPSLQITPSSIQTLPSLILMTQTMRSLG